MTSQKKTISPSRIEADRVLNAVFTEGKTLMEVLPSLESAECSAKDKALAREIVSGTCRRWGSIRYTLQQFATNLVKLPPEVQRILELSVYQLLYLDKVPDYAVISDAVELTRYHRKPGLAKVVNGILRNVTRQRETLQFPSEDENFVKAIAINESHPEWLVNQWLKQFGREHTKRLCQFNNTEAPLSLRLRGEVEQSLKELAKWPVTIVADDRFKNRVDVSWQQSPNVDLFSQPHWTTQDGATMLVVQALDPQPGWRIWDACAAPGGKTFYMVDIMGDQGKIIATDRSQTRLKQLQYHQDKLNINTIETKKLNILKDRITFDLQSFDAILVDAPCTGLGTFRRHPDLRWRLKPEDSVRLGKMALDMLQRVDPYLKPGGLLVYSTCTLSSQENEEVMNKFLNNHPNYWIEPINHNLPETFHDAMTNDGALFVFPPKWNMDGAFAVRLKKGE